MGKKRFKIKRNKFTLLEIILALAIFCLIAGLSGGLIYTVRQSYQSISDTDNYLKRQFRLDLVINEVFRNSIPLNWPALNNVDKLYFQGKNNALRTVYQYRI
ncbi:MAG: prepilin-type N-terminal cleavage/methylation domain-containing protein, partial [Victivallaceae bacterium]